MSEAQVGTIHDLLAECIACAGVFDVSTDYEAAKADLENATQAVLDHVQTLRDERDRLRGLLQEIAFDCEYVGSIQHLDKAERRTWMSVANRIKAALTPAGGGRE